jgi:hypothetical protein
MIEVEGFDPCLGLKFRQTETALDRTVVAPIELNIRQPFKRFRMAEVFGCSVGQDMVQLPANVGELKLFQLL